MLNCYSVKETFLTTDIFTLRHMKRIRIANDVQLLAIPRYKETKGQKTLPEPHDFLVFLYKSEERILSDIIYGYKDYKNYQNNIMKDLVAQQHFKAILEMTILTAKEMDKLQSCQLLPDKDKFMKKFKFKEMLFTIFESTIEINKVTPKEKILLNESIIDFENTINSSLHSNYGFKFKILQPTGAKAIHQGGKFTVHIFGVSSEELRKEWIFVLQLLKYYQGKFSLRSSLLYVATQKKLNIWSENQSLVNDDRSSMSTLRDFVAKKPDNRSQEGSDNEEDAKQARSTFRKSLYDDDALLTMQRQAKEAELPFANDSGSDVEKSRSESSEEEDKEEKTLESEDSSDNESKTQKKKKRGERLKPEMTESSDEDLDMHKE